MFKSPISSYSHRHLWWLKGFYILFHSQRKLIKINKLKIYSCFLQSQKASHSREFELLSLVWLSRWMVEMKKEVVPFISRQTLYRLWVMLQYNRVKLFQSFRTRNFLVRFSQWYTLSWNELKWFVCALVADFYQKDDFVCQALPKQELKQVQN